VLVTYLSSGVLHNSVGNHFLLGFLRDGQPVWVFAVVFKCAAGKTDQNVITGFKMIWGCELQEMFLWPGFRAAPDTVWILSRPALLHICVRAALWHGYTLHLERDTNTQKHFIIQGRYTQHEDDPWGAQLPAFWTPRTRVWDPLDPDVFWETLCGRRWPCRAPWDRLGGSSCPQQADNNNIHGYVSAVLVHV